MKDKIGFTDDKLSVEYKIVMLNKYLELSGLESITLEARCGDHRCVYTPGKIVECEDKCTNYHKGEYDVIVTKINPEDEKFEYRLNAFMKLAHQRTLEKLPLEILLSLWKNYSEDSSLIVKT
jgi:hypothetical protein